MRPSRAERTVVLCVLLALGCRAGDLGRARLALPSATVHAPSARGFDVLAYGIELELLPETRSIRAECTVRLRALEDALSEVRLDLVGLEVEGVSAADGRALAFRRTPGALSIDLAETLAPGAEAEFAIRYGGRPERGLWFAGQRADGTGPTLVFSHGQTEGSRGWFPCLDEPHERAALELTLTIPASWSAVASGERVEARVDGDRRHERWVLAFEHPSYLVGLVAGELALREGRAGDVPLQFLSEPRFEDWLEPTFAETDEVLAFLADWTGIPYPYPKYSQAAVDNFPWGGMENISATTLTPLLLGDERAQLDAPPRLLIAHEAAHQWFGDLFTCADWSHLWLNEGFATYLALLYLEHARGIDEFRAELREAQEAYLAEDVGPARRPTVWNVWKEPDDVFDTRAYQGAAARLHLLRFVLGDAAFLAGVRAYARENVGRGVVTDDLRRALERAAGRDLGRFFQQWFESPGYPEFVFAWEWDPEARELRLAVEQVQASADGTPEVFELPVEVEVRSAEGVRSLRLELGERRQRFRFPCPTQPLYVRFDAHGWIPKRMHEQKPAAEWLALARLSADVNARREAVLELGHLARTARERGQLAEAEQGELCARLAADSSAWVRADAARALGLALGAEGEEALRRAALEDAEVRVRSAALHALCAFGPDEGRASLAEDIFQSAPSYQVMAAAAALVAHAAPQRGFDFLVGALELETPHDVLATRLFGLLAEFSDPRAPGELRRWACEPALAPTARAAAVEALARMPRERLEGSRCLVPLLAEPSFHLRRAAIRALASFGDAGARRALTAYYPGARTPEERRLIEGLLAPPRP